MKGGIFVEGGSAIDLGPVFDSVSSTAVDGIVAILPYAGVILAGIIAIKLGIKVYQLIVNRA